MTIKAGIKYTNMKSRITIEVDFDNGNQPIIQILKANSDDVRDKLVQSFTEQVGGSSWLQIKWVNGHSASPDNNWSVFERIVISPIKPENLKGQAEIMLEQFRVNSLRPADPHS